MNKITEQKAQHPVSGEELMAYLDGELSKSRAAEAVAHLSECAECKSAVESLRSVSRKIREWEVAMPESGVAEMRVAGVQLPISLAEALGKKQGSAEKNEKRTWWRLETASPRLKWAAGCAVVMLAVISVLVPTLHRDESRLATFRNFGQALDESVPAKTKQTVELLAPSASPVAPPSPPASSRAEFANRKQMAELSASLENSPDDKTAERGGGGNVDEFTRFQLGLPAASGPMIIRTADLRLTAKNLDKARASVESILKQHYGYVGDLTLGNAVGSARTLTATLRVPTDQLDVVIGELKALGHVDSESQGGQDVTSQYVDLRARLDNSRNTERRLTDLLNQRTGKLSDVLQVEQELDRVRGEIEQMEAQRKTMANQVSFSTLTLAVSEEYKAQLEAVPPTTGTRLWNAAVEGYRGMVDGVVSVILFLLSSGPSLLLWAAVLFFPARGAWRMMRRRWAREAL